MKKADLGDLFAIFPDLPWYRTAATMRLPGFQRVNVIDRVQLTRANAELARRRFTRTIARYAAQVAQRRAAMRRRPR